MDPLTHALAGAVISWSAAGRTHGPRALLLGAAAGLLPDLDVLIRSVEDPLLAIEHHRGFTHSLVVSVAAGGAVGLAAVAKRATSTWPRAILAGALAWCSHALLDAATTYGTQLFWPFSRHRVGLDIISIIDPLFTLFLALGVVAATRSRRRVVRIGLVLAAVWLVVGTIQRQRALDVQRLLARSRGHLLVRGAVFPTIGNTMVWRSLYASGNSLRLDRIRVPWFGSSSAQEVAELPQFTLPPHADDRMREDVERFIWFSDGWVARDPYDPTVIGDVRYSLRQDGWEPVWGIRFHPTRNPPTEWVDRTRRRRLRELSPVR